MDNAKFSNPFITMWHNGKFCRRDEVNIDPMSHSLNYASSVFEGIRMYDGNIFRLEAHIDRLIQSAAYLGIKLSYSKQELINATKELVARLSLNNAYIRPLVYKGGEALRVEGRDNSINVVISAFEPASKNDNGNAPINLLVSDWVQPQPETWPYKAKASGMYLTKSISKSTAIEYGFDESLFLDWRGYIAEASVANIFFVSGNQIFTPFPDCFLNGITRQEVIKLAIKLGYKVHETHISTEKLTHFEECFITGTSFEIQKVGQIQHNARRFNFTKNDVTEELIKEYKKLVRGAGEEISQGHKVGV